MRTGITVSRRRGTRELAITAEIESALSQRETGVRIPLPPAVSQERTKVVRQRSREAEHGPLIVPGERQA